MPERCSIKPQYEKDFAVFHEANPHVWQMFKRFTFELINLGRTRYSADAIMHRIRWEMATKTNSDDGFKLNNNLTSLYTRLFISEYPSFPDFFEIRRGKGHS